MTINCRTLLKYLDIASCGAAWLIAIVSFFASFPPFNKWEYAYQLYHYQMPWLTCVLLVVLFRKRSWRQLWGLWLSAPVILHDWATLIFVVIALIAMGWSLHPARRSSIISRDNIDLYFGVLCWLLALGVLLVADKHFTWFNFDYLFKVAPLLWLAFVLPVVFHNKHPWSELWWVLPSGIIAYAGWAVMLFTVGAMSGRR